jgi:hypothetical protein
MYIQGWEVVGGVLIKHHHFMSPWNRATLGGYSSSKDPFPEGLEEEREDGWGRWGDSSAFRQMYLGTVFSTASGFGLPWSMQPRANLEETGPSGGWSHTGVFGVLGQSCKFLKSWLGQRPLKDHFQSCFPGGDGR